MNLDNFNSADLNNLSGLNRIMNQIEMRNTPSVKIYSPQRHQAPTVNRAAIRRLYNSRFRCLGRSLRDSEGKGP